MGTSQDGPGDPGGGTPEGEQLALIRASVRRTRPTRQDPAPERPVARVLVDSGLAHLDRTFDYLVPERLHESCVPGSRVKVRFAGQELGGFVVSREDASDHTGRLTPLRRVVSSEPVLAPEILDLARLVADRYAGTTMDVLRLAVPPRHARVEAEPASSVGAEPASGGDDAGVVEVPGAGTWPAYVFGPEFLRAIRSGGAPHAVWAALAGEDWVRAYAVAAAHALAGDRGALLVVPDAHDVARLDAACREILGPEAYVALTADLGPAVRYRRFLAVRRGQVRCVIGTRAAAFAPVHDLGLVACWDDGDDSLAEPRAPYPHAREVLTLRAHQARAAALIGGYACTAEAAHLLTTGWARAITAEPSAVRRRAPRVMATGETDAELARDPAARAARLPHKAFEVARAALAEGPVLVQVPRRGYLPALTCQDCRHPARCPTCHGPLRVPGPGQAPACGWCGRVAAGWRCPHCGGRRMRAPVVGSGRTSEELGRAFPRVPVRSSDAGHRLDTVPDTPALVVSTPGAEPLVDKGFAAALLLDPWLSLARADLRAEEEALRRWFGAAALVREGGTVVIVGDPGLPGVQALVRWSPIGYAERELAERRDAGLPPAVRLATVEGPAEAVAEFASLVRDAGLPPSARLLGPVPLGPVPLGPGPSGSGPAGPGSGGVAGSSGAGGAAGGGGEVEPDGERSRLVLRATRTEGGALARALQNARGVRSARKSPGTLRVRIDPHELS